MNVNEELGIMNWTKRILANRELRREKMVKEKKINTVLLFVFDLVEIVFPFVIALLCVGTIIYFLFHLEIEGMDTVFDFIVASMAGLLLVFSLVNKHLSVRGKYIVSGALFILLCSVGYIIVMIIALKQEDGAIARIISVASLLISIVDELWDFAKFQFGYALSKKEEKKREIDQLERTSVFDEKFDQ